MVQHIKSLLPFVKSVEAKDDDKDKDNKVQNAEEKVASAVLAPGAPLIDNDKKREDRR